MTQPRWLDDTQQKAWRGWLDSSRRIEAAVERQLRADSGLTSDDYEVLVRLSEAPERRLRMTELAAAVTNSPSRLSQRIDRLERDGLVCRSRCPEDGRAFHAVLTDAGFARLDAAAPGHVEAVRRHLIDRLTDQEVEFLADLMSRLAAPPDDDPRQGSGPS